MESVDLILQNKKKTNQKETNRTFSHAKRKKIGAFLFFSMSEMLATKTTQLTIFDEINDF